MTKKAYRIESYKFTSKEELLFDANIWLHLYGPQHSASDWRTKVYSSALARILTAGCRIFLDPLVLSEFVNAYTRYRYNTLPAATKPSDFKQYRMTLGFKPIAKEVAAACRRILSHTQRTECGFASLDIAALLTEHQSGGHDFNDQVLAELCRNKSLKFVTHDGDFKSYGITLITANKQLLKP